MIPRPMKIALLVLLVAAIGMGAYVVRLKRHAEQLEARAPDQRPIAPPVAGSKQRVTLLVANDAAAALQRESADVALPDEPEERAREVLRALVARYATKGSPHPLGAGADVDSVFLVGRGMAVVNLNAAFAAQHPSGVLSESLTVASLAQTLAANLPSVMEVKFVVEGHERETLAGHADLRGFYDVRSVQQAALGGQ